MVEQLRLSGPPVPATPPPAPPEEKPEEAKQKKSIRLRAVVYIILLVFVVAAGIPMLAIPSIRARLVTRVQTLRDAAAGKQKSPPLFARVGENQEPLPSEFTRPAPARPQPPALPKMPAMTGGMQIVDGAVARPPALRKHPSAAEKKVDTSGESTAATAAANEPSDTEPAEPVYKQGKIEQEAYEAVLKANDTVAGMVVGTNPSLRFKTWAAAKIEEDIYDVRLVFTKQPGNTDLDYIWQVKLSAKQVTPLSYYARNLSKP